MAVIETKKELAEVLAYERKMYGINWRIILRDSFTHEPSFRIWQWLKYSRMCDYYTYKVRNTSSLLSLVLYYYYSRRKMLKAEQLGLDISTYNIGRGLQLYHYSGTVINGSAIIGDNCILHGNNCIGNKGEANSPSPRLGNNVEIGVGAKIIGDVDIADNIIIGAGSVVVNSFTQPGVTIAGVPAKVIKK